MSGKENGLPMPSVANLIQKKRFNYQIKSYYVIQQEKIKKDFHFCTEDEIKTIVEQYKEEYND